MKESIRAQLDRIINIMQTDGVQPSDLAGNIFEHGYRSIKTLKSDGVIVTDICFDEVVNNIKREKVTLRYTYNPQRQLLRVEEIFADRVAVQWDREEVIKEILLDVVMKLKVSSDPVSDTFITSLPPYLQDMLKIKQATAA